VRQVTAVGQAHAQDGVTRLQQGHVDRGVGAGSGVRLYVGPIGAKQLLGAFDGQGLGDVHIFAAAVVTLAGIAFGVFVGQHAALRLHHARACVVFGGDQFQMVLLALRLGGHCGAQLGVEFLD